MAIGFGVMHLSSAQFWAMTIREFEAAASGLFGKQSDQQSLARTELDELMRRFPDHN